MSMQYFEACKCCSGQPYRFKLLIELTNQLQSVPVIAVKRPSANIHVQLDAKGQTEASNTSEVRFISFKLRIQWDDGKNTPS